MQATGGGSGNPVVFTVDPSSDPGVCTTSGTNGTTVNYTGAGNCVIDANQAGGGGYAAAAQVQQTIPVTALLTQVIGFQRHCEWRYRRRLARSLQATWWRVGEPGRLHGRPVQ